MLKIESDLSADDLRNDIIAMWSASEQKLHALVDRGALRDGPPVVTVDGQYRPQPWTEWTLGFFVGSCALQAEATGTRVFESVFEDAFSGSLLGQVVNFGGHDHGFNIVSSYGTLRRLANEGTLDLSTEHLGQAELAVKFSGCVQARRWTDLGNDSGYIYSFNGRHSLFIDTIRSMRSLALSYSLGGSLFDENGVQVDLLKRLRQHVETTSKFNLYWGTRRDIYDVKGRVTHEAIFDVDSRTFRCPSTQQGYSPFSTWMRGLAWAVLGYAELLEYVDDVRDSSGAGCDQLDQLSTVLLEGALSTADYYIRESCADGVPYWDNGAPGLASLPEGWQTRPADPFNSFEPVDSSAAAIAAQGLLRLAGCARTRDGAEMHALASRYHHAGLTILKTLLKEPYLSLSQAHEGLLLHSVYHRPNGWDAGSSDSTIPMGEATFWGDYHLRELGAYVTRLGDLGRGPLRFYLPDDIRR